MAEIWPNSAEYCCFEVFGFKFDGQIYVIINVCIIIL